MRNQRVVWLMFIVCLITGLVLSGCTSDSTTTETSVEEPAEEVGPKEYSVPSADASLQNPIPADEASIQRGEEIYTSSCVDCHGKTGAGDGLAASRLNPKPADFRADFVTQLSDGEIFYIITYGIDGTAMTARGFLDEDQRWHLVNYIRMLQE